MIDRLIDKQYGDILARTDVFNVAHSPQRCRELLEHETASGKSMFPQISTSKLLQGQVRDDGALVAHSTIQHQVGLLNVEWWPLNTGSRVACNLTLAPGRKFDLIAVWIFSGLVWFFHLLIMLNRESAASMTPTDLGVVAVQNLILILLLWGAYRYFRSKLKKDRDKSIQTVRKILGAPA